MQFDEGKGRIFMQIQNNYDTHSQPGYQQSHTHHITKCMYEEGTKKQEAAASGTKDASDTMQYTKGTVEGKVYEYGQSQSRQISKTRKKSLFRGFWDALGDEDGGKEAKELWEKEETVKSAGANMISSAIRLALPHYVINKWESVREKLKVGVGVALKRFKKEQDDLGALPDPKGRFTQKRNKNGHLSENTGKGARRKAVEITTPESSESYLMDSYSKTGEYCQLNENLSYRKKV